MKKKIGIWLSIVLIAAVAVIATWGMLSQFRPTAGSDSSDFYATSVEVSSPPAPPPELQEGQYLLVCGAETQTITVAKNIMRFSQTQFSYDSPQDNSAYESREDRWLLSVSPDETSKNYRITMEQLESSIQYEGRHSIDIVPAQPIEFFFVLDSSGNVSWEDDKQLDNTEPLSYQAYCLLQHALSSVICPHLNQPQNIAPFFEIGDGTSTSTAQYTPSYQGNQTEINIQYSQQLDTQHVNNAMRSMENAKIDPFFYHLFLSTSNGLLLNHCQDSDIQAEASGSVWISQEDPFVSTTELDHSREGYLTIPWNDPDSTYVQRLDFSSDSHYRIDVTKVEESTDVSVSRTR
ncbi:hypothetical protein NIF40_11775 [[Clostridium] leptum]|nr:hypothetical protein [[Clostridium] leptum]CZT55876.1 hypothetical protein BN3661_00963 [Eubacteriaceae bacterium CHKCI005]